MLRHLKREINCSMNFIAPQPSIRISFMVKTNQVEYPFIRISSTAIAGPSSRLKGTAAFIQQISRASCAEATSCIEISSISIAEIGNVCVNLPVESTPNFAISCGFARNAWPRARRILSVFDPAHSNSI